MINDTSPRAGITGENRRIRLAVMQPYFFPYLGYFQLFHAADKVILYDNVQFIKQGWINRNRILEINKGPRFVTIPLRMGSCDGWIRGARVTSAKDWKSPIMKLICHNYRSSPFFKEVGDLVDSALDPREERVSELAKASIRAVLLYLDWDKPFECDSSRYDLLEDELAALSFPGPVSSHDNLRRFRQFARVKALCRAEGADVYINPIGGTALYDRGEFATAGIRLFFLQPELPTYSHSSPEFVPNLSVIDVLMNLGKERTRDLLSSYRLV